MINDITDVYWFRVSCLCVPCTANRNHKFAYKTDKLLTVHQGIKAEGLLVRKRWRLTLTALSGVHTSFCFALVQSVSRWVKFPASVQSPWPMTRRLITYSFQIYLTVPQTACEKIGIHLKQPHHQTTALITITKLSPSVLEKCQLFVFNFVFHINLPGVNVVCCVSVAERSPHQVYWICMMQFKCNVWSLQRFLFVTRCKLV